MGVVSMFYDLIIIQMEMWENCSRSILKENSRFFINLDELAGKLSLYVLLRYAKIKTLPVVVWDFQIWQLMILPVFAC